MKSHKQRWFGMRIGKLFHLILERGWDWSFFEGRPFLSRGGRLLEVSFTRAGIYVRRYWQEAFWRDR